MALPTQFSSFQYRPIYQGAPLEEAAKALEMDAQAYDTNLENYNKAEALLANVKALPQDQEYLKQKALEVKGALKDITDQTTGNQRWDLAKNAVQRVNSSLNSDTKLKAINESYMEFAKGETLKAEMRAKGITPFETTDINQHRSFDDEGNVQIYRPVIEAKADYVAEADKIWKNLAPDIVEANLQPSEVEGILMGKTIKGISPEKLRSQLGNVEKTYMETDSGQQHKRFLQKNSPEKNPDKFIKDFLFGIGSLRTFNEERKEYQADPSYQWEQKSKLLEEQIAGKLALKKATGRGNYESGNERLFRVESLKTKGEVGGKMIKGNALMINNPKIIEGFSESTWVGDGSKVVPLNKDQKFDFEKDHVTGIKVKGFALDDFEGADTVGGMIAEAKVTGEDGKERQMNILVKPADSGFQRNFKTFQTINNVIKDHNQGKNNRGLGHVIEDTSGLLDFVPVAVKFRVRADNVIVPVLEKNRGGYRPPTDQEKASLMLKDNYSISDLHGLMTDKIAPVLLPYTETASQLNK